MKSMKIAVTAVSLAALALCAQAQTRKTPPATTEAVVASVTRAAADSKKDLAKAGAVSKTAVNPGILSPGMISSLTNNGANKCESCYRFENNKQTLAFLDSVKQAVLNAQTTAWQYRKELFDTIEKNIAAVKELKADIHPVLIIYVDDPKNDPDEATMYFPAGNYELLSLQYYSNAQIKQKMAELGVKKGMTKKDFFLSDKAAAVK